MAETQFPELVDPSTGTKRTPGDQAELVDLRWRGFVEADHPAAAGPPTVPPLTGTGSGRAAWAAYADSIGAVYAEDATKESIIAAVEAAQPGTTGTAAPSA